MTGNHLRLATRVAPLWDHRHEGNFFSRSPLPCLPCPPGCRGPAGPEASAGYSADFLTLAGVVGGGGQFGNKTHGSRKALVDRRDWEGPSYQTCQECRLGR